jgi:uroporphyrinogen-III synthase
MSSRQIDALVFTSSAEIYAMLSRLGADRTPLAAAPIACMGRFVKDTAQEAGLPLQITIQE